MSFVKDVSFRNSFADLRDFVRTDRPHKGFVFLLACLPPAMMVFGFYFDARNKSTPPPPQVMYIDSWPATRSRAESITSIKETQQLKDRQLADQRARYRALGRASGLDMDKIERDAEEIRVRSEATRVAEQAK
jgi:hypothetical protein